MTTIIGRAASIGSEAHAVPEVRKQAESMLREELDRAVADRVVIQVATHAWEERPIYEVEEVDGDWVRTIGPDGNYVQIGTEWRLLIEAAVEDR